MDHSDLASTLENNRSDHGEADRSAGLDPSQLTVPEWVDAVNELFPHQSKEVMQKELVRRRGIAEIMEKPELLESSSLIWSW